MHNQSSYIMCDQVNDLVPSLMAPVRKPRIAKIRVALEVGVFLLAASAYLVALTLAA